MLQYRRVEYTLYEESPVPLKWDFSAPFYLKCPPTVMENSVGAAFYRSAAEKHDSENKGTKGQRQIGQFI